MDFLYEADINQKRGDNDISFTMSGEYEKAIADYNKAIELDPNYADAYYNRGLTYCYLKQYERGIENFDIAIEPDSNLLVHK